MSRSSYVTVIFLFLAMAFTSVLYTSCNKNKCGNTVCQNSGTCQGDTCSCVTGYMGHSCDTAYTTKYLGSYTCTQSCQPVISASSWPSVMSAASTNGAFTLSITNFGNLGANLTETGTIDQYGHMTLTNSGVVAGSGTFANGKWTIHYTTNTNNVGGYDCTMIMVKD